MKKRSIKLVSALMAFMITAVTILGVYIPVEASANYKNNIVARANYLYNSTWVCKKTVAGWRGQYYFYAGNTYRMPYGQPVHSGRYIGYYVSVDDYLAATKNAGSVFYTSRSNCSGLDSVYYATDCSAFVSWCWGISRQTTATIPYYSTYMGMANASNVYNLELGDCLNSNSVGHVVLVTGLTYNKNGVLTQIEITEQTPPQLKRSYYTPQQLANKYGAYYGIYRYYGAVPAAPGGSSSTNTNTNTGQTTSKPITTMYYPKCTSGYTSFYPAMNSIGVSCDWSLHCRIAAKNGIENFTGTVAQNTELLNLLKRGELLNPDYVDSSKYYAKCDDSYTTFYAAMDSIGVSCDWDLHCKIAKANGISNFTGTAAENTKLLYLLKTGSLVIPTDSNTAQKTKYYKACGSSYTTFYAAMKSIGVSCDWELHCQIAKANGIEDFVGTAEQNTQLLNLLKKGKLVKPEEVTKKPAKQFYAACASSYTSLYPALNSIGISCDWTLHCQIAKVNGITNFKGTVAQNTQLLNLLKEGILINPNGTVGSNSCYSACDSSYATFYSAMDSIGTSCDWELHNQIAKANGIDNFEGTVNQNTQLLNLLKAGRLIKPEIEENKVTYYKACASSYTTFYAALDSIGVSCDWDLHCKIAQVNGITNFKGTAAQNTKLLNLLKKGKLINPNGDTPKVQYYMACDQSYTTFYAAMDSIGVSCDWDLHCRIAKANGLEDFTGTAAENTYLLSLLKSGALVDPGKSTVSNTTGNTNNTGNNTSSTAKGYNAYAGGMAGNGKVYAHGLDLSSWQGSNLNFQTIKNAGYSYVILRAGTTKGKDSCFETYYKKAKAAGLYVGAYYYSYATTTAGAKQDAKNMISWISGKKFEYPIYFDYEDPSQDNLSKNTSKNICLTFMDALANKGYLVGLYTGYYKSTQLLLSQICERYEFWVAYYYDNTHTSLGSSFCNRYGMYQYTSSKYVNGAGPFDANVAYKDYPSIVKNYGFNGY